MEVFRWRQGIDVREMEFLNGRDDRDLDRVVADSVMAGDRTAAEVEAEAHEGAGSGYLEKFKLYETRSVSG